MTDPFATFDLDATTATADDVNRAYRTVVVRERCHPDVRGNADRFRELTSARDAALAFVAARPCPRCDGAGVVRRARGFVTVGRRCPDCRGTGRNALT